MVDAEHSYFQPAIDHAAMELQRTYNRHKPTVLNTYQCYLQVWKHRTLLQVQLNSGPNRAISGFYNDSTPHCHVVCWQHHK